MVTIVNTRICCRFLVQNGTRRCCSSPHVVMSAKSGCEWVGGKEKNAPPPRTFRPQSGCLQWGRRYTVKVTVQQDVHFQQTFSIALFKRASSLCILQQCPAGYLCPSPSLCFSPWTTNTVRNVRATAVDEHRDSETQREGSTFLPGQCAIVVWLCQHTSRISLGSRVVMGVGPVVCIVSSRT